MSYDRKIKYLDYLENGDKIRNAGFVKIEMADGICNMQFNINGLLPTDTIQREVWITDGTNETELGNLQLNQGKGTLSLKGLSAEGLGRGRIPYEHLSDIYIPISKNREVRCKWDDRKRMSRNGEAKVRSDSVRQAAAAKETDRGQHVKQLREDVREKQMPKTEPLGVNDGESKSNGSSTKTFGYEAVNKGTERSVQGMTNPERSNHERSNPERLASAKQETQGAVGVIKKPIVRAEGTMALETVRGGNRDFMWPQNATLAKKEAQVATEPSGEKAMPTRIQEDKWKQLSSLYPHLAPFQDDRDFLAIGPNDFVILNRSFHKLVNNSFLLHGYYNYDHLILLRKVKRGTELFYIGVPGNYYEKEKQVALMYGFESFECKKEPAQEGDFGYYMIPVDL
jgi:hypothetical protein